MTDFEKIMIMGQVLNAKLAFINARQSNMLFLAQTAELAAIREIAQKADADPQLIEMLENLQNQLVTRSPEISKSQELVSQDYEKLIKLIQELDNDSDGFSDLTNFKFSPN